MAYWISNKYTLLYILYFKKPGWRGMYSDGSQSHKWVELLSYKGKAKYAEDRKIL